MRKHSVKLQGDDLANYFNDHQGDFNGNGDALCLAAGYGIKAEDGTEKCNFSDFIKELADAVDLTNYLNPNNQEK